MHKPNFHLNKHKGARMTVSGATVPFAFSPLAFRRGPAWSNRIALSPLTNCQSNPDGTLGEEEFAWLNAMAQAGYGLVMTCATQVHPGGQGFAGQLGAFSDDHLPGLKRIADMIRAAGRVSSVQLHHAGMRSPGQLVREVVAPSDDPETGARALSTNEVRGLVADFIAAAVRADMAGFDGVEIHGAHGYLLTQFFSPETNRRDDQYGGTFENRTRMMREIIRGVRAACRPDFQLGLRLSVERFGLRLAEGIELVRQLCDEGALDYIDLSLWDCAKEAEEEQFRGRSLLSWFTRHVARGDTRIGCVGNLGSMERIDAALDEGADFVMIGRPAIIHRDFFQRLQAEHGFATLPVPIAPEHLRSQGISDTFIAYLGSMPGFLAA